MRPLLTVMMLLLLIPQSIKADESQDLLRRIDSYRIAYDQFMLKVRITTYEQGNKEETSLFDVYMDGTEKSLVIAKEHETPGMKILYVNENMWVHLPDTRKPIRITPIQRLMGQASNGDVARVSYSGDYSAKVVGGENTDGAACTKLELNANSASATYHKIILWVQSEDYRPVKAEYYLISGKHVKTAYFEKYKAVNGQPTLEFLTIVDELRSGSKTTMEYLSIEKKTLPAKYFNKNYLVHVNDL